MSRSVMTRIPAHKSYKTSQGKSGWLIDIADTQSSRSGRPTTQTLCHARHRVVVHLAIRRPTSTDERRRRDNQCMRVVRSEAMAGRQCGKPGQEQGAARRRRFWSVRGRRRAGRHRRKNQPTPPSALVYVRISSATHVNLGPHITDLGRTAGDGGQDQPVLQQTLQHPHVAAHTPNHPPSLIRTSLPLIQPNPCVTEPSASCRAAFRFRQNAFHSRAPSSRLVTQLGTHASMTVVRIYRIWYRQWSLQDVRYTAALSPWAWVWAWASMGRHCYTPGLF